MADGPLSARVRTESKDSKKPKKSPVSADTIEALQQMDAAIEAATKVLKKLPGSTEPDVYVAVNFLRHPDYEDTRTRYQLIHTGESIRVVRIEIESDQMGEEYERETNRKSLSEYQIADRIQLTQKIPVLIDKAKNSELKVKTAADSAVADIYKAIEAAQTEADQ